MSMRPPQIPPRPDDLPIWMRRALRGRDYGLLITIGFALLIAWYFVIGPDLPSFNASENYVFLTSDYAESISEGRFYPRWSPHANNGYGAPIAHFFPPLTPYLSAMITVLITGDSIASVRITYALSFVFAAWGTYGLLIRHHGARVGIVAAILYITSPYFGLLAPHIIGDLQTLLALGILPLLFWATDRLHTLNYQQDFPLTVLLFAALLLTHPPLALSAFIFITVGLYWQNEQIHEHTTYTLRVIFALGLGLLLSAFYWLPALYDMNRVRWVLFENMPPAFHLSWSDLWGRYRQIDPASLTPQALWGMGWLRWWLIGLTIIGIVRYRRRTAFEMLTLLSGLSALLVGVFVIPDQVWLLGLAQFFTAISIGGLFQLIERFSATGQRVTSVMLLLVIIGTSHAAWLPPDPTPAVDDPTPKAQLDYEQRGYGVAVVPNHTPYPLTTVPDIPINPSLIQYYEADNILRFDTSVLSRTLQISKLRQNGHSARYQIFAASPQIIPFFIANFDGWQAHINNRWQPLTPTDNGLLQLQLETPINDNVTLRLGTTPIRSIAWLMSLIALLITAGITYRHPKDPDKFHDYRLLTREESRLFGVALILFAGVIFVAGSPRSPLSPRPPQYVGLYDMTPVDALTSSGLDLIGFDIDRTRLRRGHATHITLYWEATRPLYQNMYTHIFLTHVESGQTFAQAYQHPGGLPTSRWLVRRYVGDTHHIRLPHDAPSGDYTLSVRVRPCLDDVCTAPEPTFFTLARGVVGTAYDIPIVLNVAHNS